MDGSWRRDLPRFVPLSHVAAAILALAEDLMATTIDAILAKSDLELGLEVLTGRSQLFPRRRPRRPQP